MDARALLVVIVGRPGTGKTTLAKRLTGELNGAYIRIDSIVGPILRAGPIEDVRAVRVGYEIGREVARGNLELGVAVIVDGLHATHARRQQWLDVAASTGANLEFLETFLSDDDEQRRRVEQRSSGESGYLGPWWHEVQAMTYEPWDDSRSGSRLVLPALDADGRTEAVAALWTAIAFGLFRLPNLLVGSGLTQLIQVVLAAISGANLYAFRRYRGLILTAMIAHGIWDMSAFLSDSNGRDWLGAASLLLVVGGLVLGILVLVSVWRTDKTTVVTPAGIEQK